MSFNEFKKAVQARFEKLKQRQLYKTMPNKDTLWETYLSSFPPGTNPIYKERAEHDCQACKHFIRDLGGAVAIIDNKLQSIWDIKIDSFYQTVADEMSQLVRSAPIDNILLRTHAVVGVDKNHQQMPDGRIQVWEHLYAVLPNEYVVKKDEIGPKRSESTAMHGVTLRGLSEITNESIDTVLELIAQNSLYRGEEHASILKAFYKLKKQFDKACATPGAKDLFVWSNITQGAGRIRNTVIGTLLTDLSEGKELDDAVKAFESKVAPTNYKRPTALVTKAMIEKAKETVEELGLTSALHRRYAMLSDISINNILFADRNAKKLMKDNVFDQLADDTAVEVKSLDKVEEVPISDFLEKVLPKATSLEVMAENRHLGNLVSLIAPEIPEAKLLFKWGNGFSWSYTGDVTDAIKERVKQAGGVVDAEFCNRLAWHNTDDLDFHMVEPDGHTIMYMNRRQVSGCGGCLDVDANGADGVRPDPCENIYYRIIREMKIGTYVLKVHQFNARERDNIGFEVEIDIKGTRHNFVYPKAVKQGEFITVAKLLVDQARNITLQPELESSVSSKSVWGIKTHTFSKVNAVMLSPNHWDDRVVGNRHYMFMLDGCVNEGQARGFYNEFLLDELTQHRRVLEIVGSKMKTEENPHQLSGLGFSSTQRNHLFCKVQGAFNRTIKVVF